MARRTAVIFALLLLGASIIRAPGVVRGLDGRTWFSWRESDLSSVARNFQREGMNPLRPRIDWRGAGPGYAEMEFPIYPLVIAAARDLIGPHDQIGRVISFVLSILTLIVFAKLATTWLPPPAAVVSTVIMAVNPLFAQISTSILAEPLMVLATVAAVYAFDRWARTDTWTWFFTAAMLGALAVLAKATAAHIGLLLLALLVMERGWNSLRTPRPWALAGLILAPGVAWYSYAHGLWRTYGNSLGISNESHWAGLSNFTNPQLLVNMLRLDVRDIWSGGGLVLGVIGALLYRDTRGARLALVWLASAWLYLAAISRTSGDGWAYYYHVAALPPAAMLMGLGVAGARHLRPSRATLIRTAIGLFFVSLTSGLVWAFAQARYSRRLAAAAGLGALVGMAWSAVRTMRVLPASEEPTAGWSIRSHQLTSIAITAAVGWTAAATSIDLLAVLRPQDTSGGLYRCAVQFSPLIPESALILASGAACFDEEGLPVAYNASYMFYWMDRKGFNICSEEQSIEAVETFAAAGADVFVAEKRPLASAPGFEASLRRRYQVLDECAEAILFNLEEPVAPARGAARSSVPEG